jgi:hypothetical protein
MILASFWALDRYASPASGDGRCDHGASGRLVMATALESVGRVAKAPGEELLVS